MIRSSKHNITDIANNGKLSQLNQLLDDYKHDLAIYIGYIIDGALPLKKLMSSKDLPSEIITHSRYKQLIYKQASEIVRSQIKRAKKERYDDYKEVYRYFKECGRQRKFIKTRFKKLELKDILKSKYFTTPNIKNVTINLDERFFDIQDGNFFDNFVKIILPYFNEKGTRAQKVNVPLKLHGHSKSFIARGYTQKKVVQLKKREDGSIFLNFIWEKEVVFRNQGKTLGIDTGYRRLIVTSDNQFVGADMIEIYKDIVRKEKNSEAYKKALLQRNHMIDVHVKEINLDDVMEVHIEKLKKVKHKSKYNHSTNDLMARWAYKVLISRIKMICEVKGIKLVEVPPAYTSQTCSSCGAVHGESRKGDFFICTSCGFQIDADYNAAINIRDRGAYSPPDLKG